LTLKKFLFLTLLAFAFLPVCDAFAKCVTDDTGTEICLDGPPKRIVSLYGAYTEILWETGSGNLIAAKTKSDDTIPALAGLPSVGSSLRPNVELVMALRPDLTIAKASKGSSAALNALRDRGVKVAAFDPASFEELYAVIERLGALTGSDEKAGELVNKLKSDLNAVRSKTANMTALPRIVYEVRADPLTVAGSKSLVNEIIGTAGGINVFDNSKKLLKVDVEAVLKADPDVYVIQTGPMNNSPLPPDQRPHHTALRAVKEGRVLYVDEKLFSRPGPRAAEAAEVLSRFLHPGLWEQNATPPDK